MVDEKAAICGLPGQKPRATTDSCLIVTLRSMEAPKGRVWVVTYTVITRCHRGLREYPVKGSQGPLGTAYTPGYLFVVYNNLTIGRLNTCMMM